MFLRLFPRNKERFRCTTRKAGWHPSSEARKSTREAGEVQYPTSAVTAYQGLTARNGDAQPTQRHVSRRILRIKST
jgi:hypothetical protein